MDICKWTKVVVTQVTVGWCLSWAWAQEKDGRERRREGGRGKETSMSGRLCPTPEHSDKCCSGRCVCTTHWILSHPCEVGPAITLPISQMGTPRFRGEVTPKHPLGSLRPQELCSPHPAPPPLLP